MATGNDMAGRLLPDPALPSSRHIQKKRCLMIVSDVCLPFLRPTLSFAVLLQRICLSCAFHTRVMLSSPWRLTVAASFFVTGAVCNETPV
jgi:hypothetical protein